MATRNGSKRSRLNVTINGRPAEAYPVPGSIGQYTVPIAGGIVSGSKAKPKLKRFIVLEVVDDRFEAESEEKAMEALPRGRKFEVREVSE